MTNPQKLLLIQLAVPILYLLAVMKPHNLFYNFCLVFYSVLYNYTCNTISWQCASPLLAWHIVLLLGDWSRFLKHSSHFFHAQFIVAVFIGSTNSLHESMKWAILHNSCCFSGRDNFVSFQAFQELSRRTLSNAISPNKLSISCEVNLHFFRKLQENVCNIIHRSWHYCQEALIDELR